MLASSSGGELNRLRAKRWARDAISAAEAAEAPARRRKHLDYHLYSWPGARPSHNETPTSDMSRPGFLLKRHIVNGRPVYATRSARLPSPRHVRFLSSKNDSFGLACPLPAGIVVCISDSKIPLSSWARIARSHAEGTEVTLKIATRSMWCASGSRPIPEERLHVYEMSSKSARNHTTRRYSGGDEPIAALAACCRRPTRTKTDSWRRSHRAVSVDGTRCQLRCG